MKFKYCNSSMDIYLRGRHSLPIKNFVICNVAYIDDCTKEYLNLNIL